MSLYPVENAMWPYFERWDNFIHRHEFLYESRLFGVIAGTGFVVSLPFYELALTIEHCALAAINELHHLINYTDEHRWARGIHTRNIIQHAVGATVTPLVFGINLIIHSITLLNPYFYAWSKPNHNIFRANWIESQLYSARFCYDDNKILRKPTFSVDRIENLIAEIVPKLTVNGQIAFKEGVAIEKHETIADRYLIIDMQHHKTLQLDKQDTAWEITEVVRGPFNNIMAPPDPISYPLSNLDISLQNEE